MARGHELHQLLAEYQVLEKELARLEEAKKTMRAAIQKLLEEEGKSSFLLTVNGEPILLELKTHVEIRYDENLLRSRLGKDYGRILQPDIAKIRHHLAELSPILTPHLDQIGSPSRTIIKQLVSTGEISLEVFRGAFQKIQKSILFVRKHFSEPFPNQQQ
jgi:hypothetical protein